MTRPGPLAAVPAPLAASNERPTIAAAPSKTRPVIDGILNDAAWIGAAPSSSFIQKFPAEGSSPSEATTVRVVYADDALYIAMECEQRTAPLRDRLTRRDREIEADYVRVAIDSRATGTSAFEFGVNLAGVLYDNLRYNDTEISANWDETWEARTARTPRGWTAEMRIPYRILRFDAGRDKTWGFQVRRYVSARQEIDEWAFIPRSAGGEVSHYGRITGLHDVPSPLGFTLRPFVLGWIRRRDPDPFLADHGVDASGSAGLDLAWNITGDLTLDAAINPDFAQVDADQRVLNLTNFEVLFPERRPFFLSGLDAFQTPIQVLYTRRIGLAPPAPALGHSAPFQERLADFPRATTIPFTAKLVGLVGHRLSLSALTTVTAPNSVDVDNGAGLRRPRLVEPTSFYNFIRIKRDLAENAHVALLAAATVRGEPGHAPRALTGSTGYPTFTAPDSPTLKQTCPDGTVTAAAARCFRDAVVGGLDGRWRSPGGDYSIKAQVLATAVTAGAPAHLRDGTVIQPGDIAPAALVQLDKEGGEHWVGELFSDVYAPKVQLDELGYLERQNLLRFGALLEYRTLQPWWSTLETHTSLFGSFKNTIEGLNLRRAVQLETAWKLRGYRTVLVNVELTSSHFDDRELGDGTALQRAQGVNTVQSASTDPRAPVAAKVTSTLQFRQNGMNAGLDGELNLRPMSQLEIDVLTSLFVTQGEPRFTGLAPAPNELLFGRLTARSVGVSLRSTFTFTPRITFQGYAQLFLASAQFSTFSTFAKPGGNGNALVTLDALRPAAAPSTSPDFEDVSLNLNLVFRWEYVLGSTLYVVYTRAQAPRIVLADRATATLDPAALGKAPAVDVFLVKLSYFLPL